jgi:hypothetical protein
MAVFTDLVLEAGAVAGTAVPGIRCKVPAGAAALRLPLRAGGDALAVDADPVITAGGITRTAERVVIMEVAAVIVPHAVLVSCRAGRGALAVYAHLPLRALVPAGAAVLPVTGDIFAYPATVGISVRTADALAGLAHMPWQALGPAGAAVCLIIHDVRHAPGAGDKAVPFNTGKPVLTGIPAGAAIGWVGIGIHALPVAHPVIISTPAAAVPVTADCISRAGDPAAATVQRVIIGRDTLPVTG